MRQIGSGGGFEGQKGFTRLENGLVRRKTTHLDTIPHWNGRRASRQMSVSAYLAREFCGYSEVHPFFGRRVF